MLLTPAGGTVGETKNCVTRRDLFMFNLAGTRHLNYSLGTLYVMWMLFRHLTGSNAKQVLYCTAAVVCGVQR